MRKAAKDYLLFRFPLADGKATWNLGLVPYFGATECGVASRERVRTTDQTDMAGRVVFSRNKRTRAYGVLTGG
jgi:hypothetical protein